MNINKNYSTFVRDLGIIILSIFIAVILVQTGILSRMLAATGGLSFLNSFIAGFFFTSAFTTAPAIAALGQIAQSGSLIGTAFFGALGAMCGDFIIFQFMRDIFADHLSDMVQTKGLVRRLKALIKKRSFRWLTFLVGGLIIASPLPDEVGLSLLGFSKVKTSWFLPLSFVFNFLGILLVGLTFRGL